MSERVDHASKARNILHAFPCDEITDPQEAIAWAQVHATLAGVEQARIANLLKLGIGSSSATVREGLGL